MKKIVFVAATALAASAHAGVYQLTDFGLHNGFFDDSTGDKTFAATGTSNTFVWSGNAADGFTISGVVINTTGSAGFQAVNTWEGSVTFASGGSLIFTPSVTSCTRITDGLDSICGAAGTGAIADAEGDGFVLSGSGELTLTQSSADFNEIYFKVTEIINIPPTVTLMVDDTNPPVEHLSTIYADCGCTYTIKASVSDADTPSGHTFDWTGTSAQLLAFSPSGDTLQFDPSGLTPGGTPVLLTVQVAVNDNDPDGAEITTETIQITVQPSQVDLPSDEDTDGDGTNDAAEGANDSDGDLIPDYLDPANDERATINANNNFDQMSTGSAVTLKLGDIAAVANNRSATVTLEHIEQFGDNGGPATNADQGNFTFTANIFDFVVDDLSVDGGIVPVIIPLAEPIPERAVYRKYTSTEGWKNFAPTWFQVIDNQLYDQSSNSIELRNVLRSAMHTGFDSQGRRICPQSGSVAWANAKLPDNRLRAGDTCLMIKLDDGGANDADGATNRAIADPGGIAYLTYEPSLSVDVVSSGTVAANDSDLNVVMLELALSSEGVNTINSLTLKATGAGDPVANVSAVKVYADNNDDGAVDEGDVVLGTGVYSGRDLTITFSAPYTVPEGESQLLVTYDF